MRGTNTLRHLLVSLLLCSAFALAQLDRAGLNGTVTDPAGRLLPGVRIVALQDSTGLQRTTVSASNGAYDIPELPVGVYTVSFDHDGFQQLRLGNVVQTVGHTRTLNVVLKIAGITESVDVQGASLELNETSDSLSARLERKQVQDLPLMACWPRSTISGRTRLTTALSVAAMPIFPRTPNASRASTPAATLTLARCGMRTSFTSCRLEMAARF